MKRQRTNNGTFSSAEELLRCGVELERVPCALCGSSDSVAVLTGHDRLHGGPGIFRVVRCTSCGLMRTDPRPTVASIGAYYPPDYEPYLETSCERGYGRHVLSRTVDSLAVAIPSMAPGKLLEIGVGGGNYLLEMQRAGWAVEGIEFQQALAELAGRRSGAVVHAGDVLSMNFPDESFDLICGWMVFEHLHNPVEAFGRAFNWLRPGGWLAFSVPDAGSWQFEWFRDAWFALQLPTHLYHFTQPTLRACLLTHGFSNLSFRSQRTWFDVSMSLAYRLEDSGLVRAGVAQRCAQSTLARGMSRVVGTCASPLSLTGRLTVWAQRPMHGR